MVLGAINILVFIFFTATEVVYGWHDEFVSQIIVFSSADFHYLHLSDCLESPKFAESASFPCFGYASVKQRDDASRLINKLSSSDQGSYGFSMNRNIFEPCKTLLMRVRPVDFSETIQRNTYSHIEHQYDDRLCHAIFTALWKKEMLKFSWSMYL